MGLKTATLQHLELKSGALTHAQIAMRVDSSEQIVVGALAFGENHDPLSSTFTQSFIDKLPF
jgi:hypothetical protein